MSIQTVSAAGKCVRKVDAKLEGHKTNLSRELTHDCGLCISPTSKRIQL
ncbi:uncharacterized protein METZ01_LOCUS277029 [marine metagenome]|uniref:Uncharacterized protein n=1 Tax=marine metagenome TaxID=408172 RepID=A0A382KKQ5_9ZZZZ